MLISHPFRGAVSNNTGSLTFQLLASGSNSGYKNIANRDILLNGILVTASLVLEGHNATPSTWISTVGGNLYSASNGPPISASVPWLSTDNTERSVQLNGGMVYQATGSDVGDIGAEDAIIEMVLNHPKKGSTLIGKLTTTTIASWFLGANSTPTFLGSFRSQNGISQNVLTGIIPEYDWNHIMLFNDRTDTGSTGLQIAVNGRIYGNATKTGIQSTFSTSSLFTVGSMADGINGKINELKVAYIAVYKKDDWFAGGGQNSADFSNISHERFMRLTGMYPQYSNGSSIPNSFLKTTVAYMDTVVDEMTGEKQMFKVGQNWPRVIKRKSEDNQYFTGLMSEIAATNFIGSSNDFTDSGTWQLSNIAVSGNYSSSAPQFSGPFGINTGSSAVYAVGSAGRSMKYPHLTTMPAIASIFFKPNIVNTIHLAGDASSEGAKFEFYGDWTGYPKISLINFGASKPAGFATYYGNGWWRLYCRWTQNASFLSISFNISGSGIANDGDLLCYIAGAGVERTTTDNLSYGTSYIDNVSGTNNTRNADDIRFDVLNNMVTGAASISTKYLSEIPGNNSGSSGSLFTYGTNTSNFATLNLTLDGGLRFEARNNNTVQYSMGLLSASIDNGSISTITAVLNDSSTSLYRDGVLQSNDSGSSTNPSATGSFYIGNNELLSSKNMNVGIIGDIKIYNKGRL